MRGFQYNQCLRLLSVIALLAVLLLTLSACAGSSAPLPSPTASAIASPETGANQRGPDTEQTANMKDEHSLSWQTYEVVSPTTLRIPFVGNGDSRCYGFRATVEETPKEVRIRLLSGTLPKAPRACTLPALHSTLLVQLKAPLSDRVVYAVE